MKFIAFCLVVLSLGSASSALAKDSETGKLLRYREQICVHPDDEQAASPHTIVTCNGRTVGYGMSRTGADTSRCSSCEKAHPEGGCVIKKVQCAAVQGGDILASSSSSSSYHPYSPQVLSLRRH